MSSFIDSGAGLVLSMVGLALVLNRENKFIIVKLHCCGDDLQTVRSNLQSDLYQVQDWLQANRL